MRKLTVLASLLLVSMGASAQYEIRMPTGSVSDAATTESTTSAAAPMPEGRLEAGENHVSFIGTGGVWAAGRNDIGMLGVGSTTQYPYFFRAAGVSTDNAHVSTGGYFSYLRKTNNTYWSTGYHLQGALGLGGAADVVTSYTQVIALGADVKKLEHGTFFSAALKTDGSVLVTGQNENGQLGLGHNSNIDSLVPSPSAGTDNADLSSSHVFALKKDGTVWGAGLNTDGQLGLGDNVNHNSFTEVTDLGTNVRSIYLGVYHSVAIKTDGSIWAAGSNAEGQLGLGNNASHNTFTEVTDIGTYIKSLVAGGFSTYVVKNDGTLWVIGGNSNGQLGISTTANINTWAQVPGVLI